MNLPTKLLALNESAVASERVAADPFVVGITRLLLTFFSIVLIDIVVVSLMTQRLRFWFPLWLDPQWASRPDPWAVYSQSYFAGICMIPILYHLIDRDFFGKAGSGIRAVFWSLGLSIFAFVLWWKGSLMIEYHKHYEALGWAALTAVIWPISSRFAELLPERARGLSRREMLKGLLFGVSLFFLVISVVDPLLQLGVHQLSWSSGLTIEVGFFLPVGVVLMILSHRLRA